MTSGQRRVVITGMGCVTPLGNGVERFWNGLVNGVSGVREITRFDPERFACRLAAEVDDDQIPRWEGDYAFEIRRTDPFVQYALASSYQTFEDAGFSVEEARKRSGALFFGVAMGGLGTIESGVLRQEALGPRKTTPYFIPSLIPNMAAGIIALKLGLDVGQHTYVGGCASGLQAVGEAMHWIRERDLDWALCGGSEAVITPITFSGFQAMGALSPAKEYKATPRPFDRQRDGMIVGEGAAVLLLESLDAALARGAKIYAEVLGYATGTVTQRIFIQHCASTARCLRETLKSASLEPLDVDCIYAHAGGLDSDASEMEALDEVFTQADAFPLLSSIKGHVGYAFGASGPMDVLAGAMTLYDQKVSPTLNFESLDSEHSRLRVVAESTESEIEHCLVNSFGLGGVNAGLLLKRHPARAASDA